MIRPKYKENTLLIKEMLSSCGGWGFTESMAPMLTHIRPFRDKLMPLERLNPVAYKEWDGGTFHGKMNIPFVRHTIMIDENNSIEVFKEYQLGVIESEGLLESFVHYFYEFKINELLIAGPFEL